MTDQQLRAMQKKHLMLIIRDLEQNLQQAEAEKESLMLAFQYGFAQGQRDANAQEHPQQYINAGQPAWQLPAEQQQYPALEAPPQDVWYPQQTYAQQQGAWQIYPGPLNR